VALQWGKCIRCLGLVVLGLVQFLFTGCSAVEGLFPSHLDGPPRNFLSAEETQALQTGVKADFAYYNSLSPAGQKNYRNNFITARMYLIDVAYDQYELSITRSAQDESFATAAANIGLTGAAALIPAAQTKSILSGIAGGITGVDSLYSQKILLSQTIQNLEGQMRASRATEAAAIYTKMKSSSSDYTLGQAFSDIENYYAQGTITSALVALSKTVSTAQNNATTQKDLAGPNGVAVANAKINATGQ
jgi:hypothetical protein